MVQTVWFSKQRIECSMKRFVCFAIFYFLLIPPSKAMAEQVYWGGVSFAQWEDHQTLYPNVARFLCRGDNCPSENINSWALSALDNAEFDNFTVSLDYISGNAIEGVIMTPMITGESLAIVKDVTGKQESYIHVYRVYASLLFFEFGSGRFVAAKPVVTQYTDTLKARATETEISTAFARLLGGGGEGPNTFEELFKRGQRTVVSTLSDRFVRVSSVEISEDAANQLTGIDNLPAWKVQIARAFESYLMEASDAPMVPTAQGDELTGEFIATFANAATKIKLPLSVPYEFGIEIRRFMELETVQRKQKTICHAVALTIRLDGPMERILEAPLVRTKESCGVVAIDKTLDQNYYLSQSLLSLLKETTKNFSAKPDQEFIKRASPNSKKLDRQFSAAWNRALNSNW